MSPSTKVWYQVSRWSCINARFDCSLYHWIPQSQEILNINCQFPFLSKGMTLKDFLWISLILNLFYGIMFKGIKLWLSSTDCQWLMFETFFLSIQNQNSSWKLHSLHTYAFLLQHLFKLTFHSAGNLYFCALWGWKKGRITVCVT